MCLTTWSLNGKEAGGDLSFHTNLAALLLAITRYSVENHDLRSKIYVVSTMFCYRIRSTTRRNTGTEDWEIHSAERYNLLACCQMHAHAHRCKLALEMHVQSYVLHWLVYFRKEEDCTIPELFNLYLNYAHFVNNLIICNFLNFLCGFYNYHIFYLPLIS